AALTPPAPVRSRPVLAGRLCQKQATLVRLLQVRSFSPDRRSFSDWAVTGAQLGNAGRAEANFRSLAGDLLPAIGIPSSPAQPKRFDRPSARSRPGAGPPGGHFGAARS